MTGFDIAAAYICRNVNYADDGEASEHARGRAIDISQLCRKDGTNVSVFEGWHDEDDGPLLREIHRAACGIFSTTLGPDSDPYHVDPLSLRRRRPASIVLPLRVAASRACCEDQQGKEGALATSAGYAESFNASPRAELLHGEIFCSFQGGADSYRSRRRHYNAIRPHSALRWTPPAP